MTSQCPCGQNYDLKHAINCKNGGFVIMRHNNVEDFEENLLKTTLNYIEIESKLQKIDNKGLSGLTADDARPDIRAREVWRQGQNAFFDIPLTNTNALSRKHLRINAILKKTQKIKKESL